MRIKKLSVLDRHILAVAEDTLKMSDFGASIFSSMTKDEARIHIFRLTGKAPDERNIQKNN